MEFSNIKAANFDFKIKRNSYFRRYFRFAGGNGAYVDLAGVIEIKMDIVNLNGAVIDSYSLGDGFKLGSDTDTDLPGSDSTWLIMKKLSRDKNVKEGVYTYDLKITLVDNETQYPMCGKYTSIDYKTK